MGEGGAPPPSDIKGKGEPPPKWHQYSDKIPHIKLDVYDNTLDAPY